MKESAFSSIESEGEKVTLVATRICDRKNFSYMYRFPFQSDSHHEVKGFFTLAFVYFF